MITSAIIDWDNRILSIRDLPDKVNPHLVFAIKFKCGLQFFGNNIMFELPDNKTATVNVAAVDDKGRSAPVESIAFASSNDAVVTVDLAGVLTPVSAGSATITVTADAMIGEGIALLSGSIDIDVMEVVGQAVSLQITAALNA